MRDHIDNTYKPNIQGLKGNNHKMTASTFSEPQ